MPLTSEGGGGNLGRSNLSNCSDDWSYACASLRISATASKRTFSLLASMAASSARDLEAISWESGSL
jgi:hypothetical protein